MLDRGLSGDVELGSWNRSRGLAHVIRVAFRVRRIEARDDRRVDDVAGNGGHRGDLAGGKRLRRAHGCGLDLRDDGGRASLLVLTTIENDPSGFWPK